MTNQSRILEEFDKEFGDFEAWQSSGFYYPIREMKDWLEKKFEAARLEERERANRLIYLANRYMRKARSTWGNGDITILLDKVQEQITAGEMVEEKWSGDYDFYSDYLHQHPNKQKFD